MRALLTVLLVLLPFATWAQDPVKIATVSRAPFSFVDNGQATGFSMELWDMVAADLGIDYEIVRTDSFSGMLDMLTNGTADGAISNISVTAEREVRMDFTQPIFDSGLQIMIHDSNNSTSLWAALVTRDIGFAVLAAAALLFGGGMLMWVFERGRSEYFSRPAREVMFPAFWWALNLVVNGGFEERMPNSRPGRFFAVLLVVCSLFLVSVFVAKITAAMTVNALQNSIENLSDLEGKKVGTIAGSTASTFLSDREVLHSGYETLEGILADFEDGVLDAVVFDKPILAYYIAHDGRGKAHLIDRTFKPENYAMALPTGSPLREQIDQSLLKLRENGAYDRLRAEWFGSTR
ncbi:transporter substrate-binding domain-containing protein [uncultured Litoreibacter sp.]|uniref:transporter substrate-binding domain-containing protein n=1 Tax=uncultured Litoreibacter sp. TaxID=1392394 RepID=UPI002623E539|nr:transporter substrate-binding domain-containing protein [uncultured Litoreibacter sp.]